VASGWSWALAVAALVAGLAFGLGHGAVQVAFGLVEEPVVDRAPAGLRPLPVGRSVRVLILGTSLTAGGSWTAALERQLAACHGGPVVVERLARPGANSAWGEGALRDRLAAGPDPDLLVIEFSINDSSLWRGMTLGASRARHEAMLGMARAQGVPVWLATMSPAFGRKAWERPGQVAYRALYADLAQDQRAGLIAMIPAWTALDAEDRARLMPDNLHPTDEAMQALVVPALTAGLGAVICDRA
jgi:lysophospholipase L1-like esterase